MLKKNKSIWVGVVLLTLLCVILSGCKPSPVLTEIVYDDTPEIVDTQANQSSVENEADNTDPDENLPPRENDEEADSARDRDRETPLPDETQDEQNEVAPDTVYDPGANSDSQTDAGSTESTAPENPAEEGADSPAAEETVPEIDTSSVRQIVDARGRVVDIPERVRSVCAVGEAAVFVCMLGGSDKLAATSESLSSGLSSQILSAPDSAVLWRGAGKSPLSSADFNVLLDCRPQVCFEISGQITFSEAQIEALAQAGIAYVVLPSLNSGSNICQAVRVVGTVLGNENGVDAPAKAEEYIRFYQKTLDFVASRVDPFSPDGINYDTREKDSSLAGKDGVYTLFVSGWDSAVRYTLHDDAYVSLDGIGLPVTKTGYTASPVSYFLSMAGVANSAALAENCYSPRLTQLKYINPVISPNKALSVSGGTGADYDTRYVLTSADGYSLGQAEFFTIIAANQTIRDNIEKSPLWKNYGQISSATGLTNGYGFLDQNGDIVTTTIQGDYSICVLPDGVGSWADGSAESVLTSVWAAWRIRGVVTETEVKSFLSDFYQQFYNYTLSDSQMDSLLLIGT